MIFLYNLSIQLYIIIIRIASLWNKKAGKWLQGRKHLFEILHEKIQVHDRIIWVHCSSAGEFEQGKPIIEKFKSVYPSHKILVSFFSPSGFETAKNYSPADHIIYLPADTKENARKFLEMVHPELVVFIKYEFWYHHLSQAAFRHIPIILASAVFRSDQLFFKKRGKFYRQVLFLFRHIFVQDRKSLEILHQNGITHSSLGGDTRFDRVAFLGNQNISLPAIEVFLDNQKAFIAGSTWTEDEALIKKAFEDFREMKLVIAPHEVSAKKTEDLLKLFPGAFRYSLVKRFFESSHSAKGIWNYIDNDEKEALLKQLKHSRILLIDNVGMLSRLYAYATISYVGGGFSRDGIHNVLEPATFGKPVIFGPNYKKYREASELIEAGAAFSVQEASSLKDIVISLVNEENKLNASGQKAKEYIRSNEGASAKLLDYIQENRLLTN